MITDGWVTHSDGERIVEATPAALAEYLDNQPYADFSGEEGCTVISAVIELLRAI